MNNLKKILAVLLAVLMIVATAGCSRKPGYSYKTDNTTYAEGIYIYSMFSAYNEAYSILQNNLGDNFDPSASILNLTSTFDESGEEMLCNDWVIKQADLMTRQLIVLDEEIAKYSITLDKNQLDSARTVAKEDWYLGPYYEYYVASGYDAVSYKSVLEPFGVSFDSYLTSTTLASAKQSAIFNHLYNKGGEKEVSDSEITKYFTDNYTSYAYFPIELYESTTDDSTGQKVYFPYSDELIKDREKELDSYVKLMDKGTEYSEIISEYMKKHDITIDPTVENTEILETSSLGEEILKALKGLDAGKATYIRVGEGDTSSIFFITKFDINAKAESYLSADGNRDVILQNLKSEEFFEYLDKATEELNVKINEKSINKYTPAIFEEDL